MCRTGWVASTRLERRNGFGWAAMTRLQGRGSDLREQLAGWTILGDAADGRFTVVRVVLGRSVGSIRAVWIERYLSQVGATVGVFRDKGDRSLVEEVMDD